MALGNFKIDYLAIIVLSNMIMNHDPLVADVLDINYTKTFVITNLYSKKVSRYFQNKP